MNILNLGGGYKGGRMPDEFSTDLQVIGKPVREAFEAFAEKQVARFIVKLSLGHF